MPYFDNLAKARKQALANVKTFGVPYYIVGTTMGMEVTRERPEDKTRIIEICIPPDLT